MIDPTSLWVWWQKHRSKLGYMIAGLLLFIAGWHTGKVTSPYYASHPIVFQDVPADATKISGGTVEELVALREQGQKEDRGEPSPLVSPPQNSPAVAAAQTQTQSEEKMFVGSVNSDKYHLPDCPSAKRIKPENQIWFASQEEAQVAGYEPSACTQEKLGL